MPTSQRDSRSRRRRSLGFVRFAPPILAACAAQEEPAGSAAEVAFEFELVSDDPAVAARELAPPAEGDLLLADDFDSLDSRWSSLAEGGTAGSPQGVELVAEGAGARGFALLSPGTRGFEARIETARTDALLVTARVRSFSAARDALLRASNVPTERRKSRPVTRPVASGATFTEWSLVLEPCRDRKAVQIDVVPGDRALAVDRIEVRCLRPVEEIWLAPPDDDAPPLPRGRHRVEIAAMDVEMEGIYVPAGGALRWRARVPSSSPRLDLETCLVGGDRGGKVEWSVVVDGSSLARRKEQLAPAERDGPFSPWVVPLDRFAGREIGIELRCAGDRDVVGFAGAPRLLGGKSPSERPNVVVISLDTLRADRVGRRIEGRSLTPNLDRLVERGVLFTGACSTSSWTLPAQSSLLTGQHPLVHGAIDYDRRVDARRSPLLAERFRRQGYSTAAFTAGVFLDPRFGLAPGFDLFSMRDPCGVPHDVELPRSPFDPRVAKDPEIGATPERAFDWIRRHADVPFFLFLHTYHVHEYDDDAHDGAGSGRRELMDRATAGDAQAVAELTRRYDACVVETDRDLVGGLLDLLDRLGLAERTLVAVASDHGEEFLEHGGFRHGLTLRDEVGSVALALSGPGIRAGDRIDAPVSLTDVAPTLARLAGLPSDPRCFGRDLFGDNDEPRAILLHLDRTRPDGGRVRGEALRLGDWQVQRMWSERGEATLAFERRDRASGLYVEVEPSSEERRALERRLDAEIVERLSRAPPVAESGRHELPEALQERLKALGYVGH